MKNNKDINFIVNKIDDLKGQDIIFLDVRNKSSITDYMIICTGTSNRHTYFIAQYIIRSCRNYGLKPLRVDGKKISEWIIIDLNDIIVHIMQEEFRNLYELEKIWG